jgi:hypothetical protein
VCAACTRNHILCDWTERKLSNAESVTLEYVSSPNPSQRSRAFSVSSNASLEVQSPSSEVGGNLILITGQYVANLNLAAYGVKSSREADLLRHAVQNIFPTLISIYADPGFRQPETWIASSSQPRPLKEALLALSSLHVSKKGASQDPMALGYYSSSVQDLRRQVGYRSMTGSEDHLLMNVVWFYIFEIWGLRLDHLVGAATHLKGALQILKLRQSSNVGIQNGIPNAMDRLCAESVLYNLGNMAFFDKSLCLLPISKVRDVLGPLLAEPSFPNASSIANAPVLGVPAAEMYFLVLEVSQLSHCTPFSDKDRARGTEILEILEKLRMYPDNSPFATPTDIHTQLMYEAAYLYVLAAKTLLFLLLNPNTSHTHCTIQGYASQAMSILRTGVMGQPCKQFFCWPLLILSSVLELLEDISFMHHELQAAWRISSCGNVLVVLQVFETLTQRRLAGERVNTIDYLGILQGKSTPSIFDSIQDRIIENS